MIIDWYKELHFFSNILASHLNIFLRLCVKTYITYAIAALCLISFSLSAQTYQAGELVFGYYNDLYMVNEDSTLLRAVDYYTSKKPINITGYQQDASGLYWCKVNWNVPSNQFFNLFANNIKETFLESIPPGKLVVKDDNSVYVINEKSTVFIPVINYTSSEPKDSHLYKKDISNTYWYQEDPSEKNSIVIDKDSMSHFTIDNKTLPVFNKKNTVATSPSANDTLISDFFGDYLNPFSLPPIQQKTVSLLHENNSLTGKNISGYDLSNHDLSGKDFTDTDLSYANLSYCNLSNATFKNAILDHVSFEGATGLTAIQLSQSKSHAYASFNYCDFSNENFVNIDFSTCSFQNANLKNTVFNNSILHATDFSYANMSNAQCINTQLNSETLFNSTILDVCNFSHSTILPAHLNQAQSYKRVILSHCNFSKQNLHNMNFTDCILTGLNLKNATCSNVNFTGATISAQELADVLLFDGAQLDNLTIPGTNFTKKSLKNASMKNTNAQNSIFDDADLNSFTIVNSNLSNSSFLKSHTTGLVTQNSFLKNVNFTGTNLSHLDFSSCNLENAILNTTNPTGASFLYNTSLSDIQMSKAFGPILNTKMFTSTGNGPENQIVTDIPTLTYTGQHQKLFITPIEAIPYESIVVDYLERQNLPTSESNTPTDGITFFLLRPVMASKRNSISICKIAALVNKDYSLPTLTMNVQAGNMQKINNKYRYLSRGMFNYNIILFDAPSTSLTIDDVSHQTIHYSMKNGTYHKYNFSYSHFINMDATNADFTGSNFSHTHITASIFTNANLTNTDWSYAQMWGTISNTNFSNALVSYTSFENSSGLTGTQLMQTQKNNTGINLKKATLTNALLNNRDFSHAIFSHSQSSNVNFSNCICTGMDASHADFHGSNFSEAHLSQAIFDDSNCQNANFKNAQLENASFKNADLRGAIFSSEEQLKQANTTNAKFDKILKIEKDVR